MTIKDLVKDNTATFDSYRCGTFYYTIPYLNENTNDISDTLRLYQFPIPVDDLGNATLNKTEKAIHLMRYIRKAMEEKTLVKV